MCLKDIHMRFLETWFSARVMFGLDDLEGISNQNDSTIFSCASRSHPGRTAEGFCDVINTVGKTKHSCPVLQLAPTSLHPQRLPSALWKPLFPAVTGRDLGKVSHLALLFLLCNRPQLIRAAPKPPTKSPSPSGGV